MPREPVTTPPALPGCKFGLQTGGKQCLTPHPEAPAPGSNPEMFKEMRRYLSSVHHVRIKNKALKCCCTLLQSKQQAWAQGRGSRCSPSVGCIARMSRTGRHAGAWCQPTSCRCPATPGPAVSVRCEAFLKGGGGKGGKGWLLRHCGATDTPSPAPPPRLQGSAPIPATFQSHLRAGGSPLEREEFRQQPPPPPCLVPRSTRVGTGETGGP